MLRSAVSPTRLAVLLMGCAMLLTAAPAALSAQGSPGRQDSASSCLTNIPDSLMRRVRVLVQAELIDSTDQPILPQLDLLAQEVTARARALLGASPDSLPNGEPTVTWRGLGPDLLVVIHHHGQTAWAVSIRALPPSTQDDTVRAAARVLARALADADSEYRHVLVVWPEGFAPDSVAFYLAVRHPIVDGHGVIHSYRVRRAFPLLFVSKPTATSAAEMRRPPVVYPTSLQRAGVTGNLIMRFVVDTTGVADMTTVKDIWPASQPPLTGEKRRYYESLRQAILDALPDARYEPARIGGCKVRQLVEQPYSFDFEP